MSDENQIVTYFCSSLIWVLLEWKILIKWMMTGGITMTLESFMSWVIQSHHPMSCAGMTMPLFAIIFLPW